MELQKQPTGNDRPSREDWKQGEDAQYLLDCVFDTLVAGNDKYPFDGWKDRDISEHINHALRHYLNLYVPISGNSEKLMEAVKLLLAAHHHQDTAYHNDQGSIIIQAMALLTELIHPGKVGELDEETGLPQLEHSVTRGHIALNWRRREAIKRNAMRNMQENIADD